jgi:uncharacterized protein DUF3667
MPQVVEAVCPSCGAPQPAKFCERCGEKRITTHDYAIAHFVEHALEAFTHFDIKSVRTLKVLALKPGELTRAYLDGRRKPFVGPIQLFVIVNVVFALFGANTFRTPLTVQQQSWFPGLKARMVAEAKAVNRRTDEEFEREFDKTAATQAKTWVFTMIPAYALIVAALYGFRRYFFEHLIFATHFIAFLMLWILAAGITIVGGLRLAGIRTSLDGPVSIVLIAGLLVYLYAALRRTYGDRWYAAAARAAALIVVFLPLLRVYRLLLFFVTLRAMH